jgi:hypothetical protein
MKQSTVVLSPALKDFSKMAIHRVLVVMLQENALSYRNAMRFFREAVLGLNSEEVSRSSPKDDDLDEVNKTIQLALFGEPFSSVG